MVSVLGKFFHFFYLPLFVHKWISHLQNSYDIRYSFFNLRKEKTGREIRQWNNMTNLQVNDYGRILWLLFNSQVQVLPCWFIPYIQLMHYSACWWIFSFLISAECWGSWVSKGIRFSCWEIHVFIWSFQASGGSKYYFSFIDNIFWLCLIFNHYRVH